MRKIGLEAMEPEASLLKLTLHSMVFKRKVKLCSEQWVRSSYHELVLTSRFSSQNKIPDLLLK